MNPPLQTAVLQQEDPETDRDDPETDHGPVKFALSNFNLQLGKGISMDLPTGRAWQRAGFMAVLSLWYRHQAGV